MGRVVAQRPGGEGLVIWALRLNSLAAPTRLRPYGLSHPPHEGEGEVASYPSCNDDHVRAVGDASVRAGATAGEGA